MKAIKRWRTSDDGATAIEYALIASVISIGILAAVTSLGTTLTGMFQAILAGF